MRSLTFEPLIPPALWLLLAAASVGLLAWYAISRPPSVRPARWFSAIGLTGAGLAIVLVILLNPIWLETKPPPAGKPTLTIAIDSSGSMATTDAAGSRSRFKEAQRIARSTMEGVSDYFDVRLETFAATSSAGSIEQIEAREPEGASTDVASAITEAIQSDQPLGQALLILSDGIHNAGAKASDVLAAVRLAKGLNVPIYTRTIGGESGVRDLALELDTQQELAFIGQSVPISVRISQTGLALAEAVVTLSEGGKDLERQQVKLDAAGLGEAQFFVRQKKTGVYRYEAKVEPYATEATLVNNFGSFLLRVVDTPIRVLVLEGKPYWDAKFFVRTLTSDPSIELDSLVVMTEGRLLHRSLGRAASQEAGKGTKAPAKAAEKGTAADDKDATPAKGVESWRVINKSSELLSQPKFLSSYQILVVGRNSEVFFTDEFVERVRDWVSRENGSLVCYRGAPLSQINQRFAKMLPVRWQSKSEGRFHLQLTDRGRDMRWLAGSRSRGGELLTQLPTLAASTTSTEANPLSVVLATSGSRSNRGQEPVVTYQPYGEGRVVVVEGAGMWRWAFLAPQYRQHDGVYSVLWQSLLRWLVSSYGLPPGQKIALRTDRVTFRADEQAFATLLMRTEGAALQPPSVELTGDGMKDAKTFAPAPVGDAPGTFRVSFGKLPEGRYQARIAGHSARDSAANAIFDVRNQAAEKLHLTAKPDLMKRIASESGGAVYDDSSPRSLVDAFRQHTNRGRLDQVTRTAAWDRWWVLLAAFACWGFAWKLRRSSGLV